eukprot:gene11978-16034_t
MSLLPKSHEEFHDKTYWDQFFLRRDKAAFEWYGNYSDYHDLLIENELIHKEFTILVIGCGNSDFSSSLYDSCYDNKSKQSFYKITNLDFSSVVIEEMKIKNEYRKNMSWIVGDMTNMRDIAVNESYDIVFDKGALDALMSVENTETIMQSTAMFDEIVRILNNNGKYICITLGESFIFRQLLLYFNTENYKISINCVNNTKPSPFIPLFIVITKYNEQASNHHNNTNRIIIRNDQFGHVLTNSIECNAEVGTEKINQIQEFHRKQFELSQFSHHRFETMHLWSTATIENSLKSDIKEHQKDDNNDDIPKFTVYILDANEYANLSCAVFLIPMGRESDYQFTTLDGLSNIAQQANCKRLLAVSCNRPHYFQSMEAIQAELSPIALSLKLSNNSNNNENIPFMALNIESDWNTIYYGNSLLTGKYIIEENDDNEENNNDDTNNNNYSITRRLIFLQNQHFIQTEMQLFKRFIDAKIPKKKKKKNKKNYLDEHHKAMLLSLIIFNNNNDKNNKLGLIIGLGGGALPMVIHRYLSYYQIFTCDLDPEMEKIAIDHFGFHLNDHNQVVICEGVELLENMTKQFIDGQKIPFHTTEDMNKQLDI